MACTDTLRMHPQAIVKLREMTDREVFDGALDRYLAKHMPQAEELLSLTECEPLSASELLQLCPELDAEIRCDVPPHVAVTHTDHLRSRIASVYRTISPRQVHIEGGGKYALFSVMRTLLRDRDEVIIHVPAFPPLHPILAFLNCKITPWVADRDRDWALDLDFLADRIGRHTKALVFCCPHDPTGYVPTLAVLAELVAICRKHGVFLLCNEIYRTWSGAGSELPAIADVYERGISVGSVSQVLGLPGARIGWFATHADEAHDAPPYSDVSSNLLGQVIADRALANRVAISIRSNAIVHENMGVFARFLRDHADTICCDGPLGSPMAFPRLVDGEASATSLCLRLIAQHRTLAVPSSVLDFTDQHIRIGLGRRRFPVGLGRLSEVLARPSRPARRSAKDGRR